MAKNTKHTRRAQVVLALPVASGVVGGEVVILGTAGLKGFALTDRATTAFIAAGTAAPGLLDGEDSVELLGVSLVVELTIATVCTQYAKCYRVTADGTYSNSATGGVFVGWFLQTNAAPGLAKVALAASVAA